MSLEVSRLALETIATLRPLVPRIRRHDRSLAVQLVRAASSTILNLGEGEYSDPGTKRAPEFPRRFSELLELEAQFAAGRITREHQSAEGQLV